MRRLVYLWPVPALVAALVASGFSPVAWTVALLTLLTLWPATMAAGLVGGTHARIATSAGATALVLGWTLFPPPTPVEQGNLLDKRFWRFEHAMRHTIRLPLGSREWAEMWSTPIGPAASLWFFVSVEEPRHDATEAMKLRASMRRLTVTVNGEPLGRLGQDTTVGGPSSDEFGRMDWHHLPLTRHLLERDPALEIVVQPDPSAPPPEGEIGLLGGFAFRNTAGPHPSAFYDGRSWSTAFAELFDVTLPRSMASRATPRGDSYRYFIELRLVHTETRRVLAIFY